jgi:gamma-glutamyl-gamma-aminobutyrate hydrolase PuuD
MKKIYVVGGWDDYASWINDHVLVDKVEDADIVLFTGGEDVDPSLYGKEKHYTTFSNLSRDLEEKEIFEKVRPDQVCLGICRGSQFLCVMNGGLLVQNCTNHAIGYTHTICNNDKIFDITSTHHQMQYPYNMSSRYYDILYFAYHRSDKYEGDGIDPEPILKYGEPEIVLYDRPNKPKCLAIQGHPEMMRKDAPIIDMLNDLLNQICNK